MGESWAWNSHTLCWRPAVTFSLYHQPLCWPHRAVSEIASTQFTSAFQPSPGSALIKPAKQHGFASNAPMLTNLSHFRGTAPLHRPAMPGCSRPCLDSSLQKALSTQIRWYCAQEPEPGSACPYNNWLDGPGKNSPKVWKEDGHRSLLQQKTKARS